MIPSPARCRGIPLDTPHTVIISLPGWEDNVELARGNKILIDSLEVTYPRFVIHMFVQQVRCIYTLLSFWFMVFVHVLSYV